MVRPFQSKRQANQQGEQQRIEYLEKKIQTEDVTKEMYPVVVRALSYQRADDEKIVFEFSRRAQAKSDWVFLSMKDPSGTRCFVTAEAKIAALPCLNSTK